MYSSDEIKIYIPKKLGEKLRMMERYPLIILQANSGFGKTTAINEFLRAKATYNVYSYICMEENYKKVWHGICDVFSRIDDEVYKKLKQIAHPTEDNLHDIRKIISACNINKDTFLIIDNFQQIQKFLPKYFFYSLACHENSLLHIIIMTDHINEGEIIGIPIKKLLIISNNEFIFSKEDINLFFRANGAILTESELEKVETMSKGWICALNLQLIHFLNEGNIKVDNRLNHLIRTMIYEPLDAYSRQILLSLSLLGRFSLNQIHIITDKNKLPDKISRFLSNKAFVRYQLDDELYTLNESLQKFLTDEIEKLEESTRKSMYETMGDAYAFVGDRYNAFKAYLEAKEMDKLISLSIKATDFSLQPRESTIQILEKLLVECDKDILMKNPQLLSQIVFELYRLGSYALVEQGCVLIKEILCEEKYSLKASDRKLLKAQLYLIESFKAFNDIEKMSALHQKAYEILEGPFTNKMKWDDSWTFGQTSVLYLFWNKIGNLDNTLNSMDSRLKYYINLTRGHGSGANHVMRAETLLMRGDDLAAEVLAHKAIYTASLKNQDSICFAGEMILLRIAVLRGDAKEYNTMCNNILDRIKNCKEPDSKKMADMALAFVAVKFDKLNIASWLTDIEKINYELYDVAIPFGMIIYLNVLLENKEYTKVIAIGEELLHKISTFNFLLCKVYIHIMLCISYLGINAVDKAEESFEEACSLAFPDEVYLPFAEYANEIAPLLDKRNNTKLNDLCKRQSLGQEKIKKTIKQNRLSPRERKVATLASDGLTNKEIANRLYISVETVKTTMKSIFQKQGIKSRVQLKELKDNDLI